MMVKWMSFFNRSQQRRGRSVLLLSPEGVKGRLIMSKPKPEQDEKGRFISGNSGGGRPKGSRNQLGEAFIADLYEHWQIHGMAAIRTVCDKHPADYLKIIASILPKDVNMNVSPFEHMTDAELNASIRRLLADAVEREGLEPTEH
jgi:hypothetical protein